MVFNVLLMIFLFFVAHFLIACLSYVKEVKDMVCIGVMSVFFHILAVMYAVMTILVFLEV